MKVIVKCCLCHTLNQGNFPIEEIRFEKVYVVKCSGCRMIFYSKVKEPLKSVK